MRAPIRSVPSIPSNLVAGLFIRFHLVLLYSFSHVFLYSTCHIYRGVFQKYCAMQPDLGEEQSLSPVRGECRRWVSFGVA